MKNFEYVRPETIAQVCSLLSEYGEEAKVIAGGQSLMILLKHRLLEPSYLIDIKALSDLDYLTFDEKQGLRIGSIATQRAVEVSPIVKTHYDVLSKTLQTLSSIQIRNYGTVGGNLCHADPSSDIAPPLIVLGAKVKLSNSKGDRVIPLEDFFVDYYETVLGGDEILTEIQVPIIPRNGNAIFKKLSIRKTDRQIVGGAIMIVFSSDKKICEEARIVLSAVGPIPLRIKRSENAMKGQKIRPDLINKVAQIALEEIDPPSDVIASKEYKREMVKVLIKRLINEITAA
jgi:aerobic carbon-monoxide dehydrogenase medium subunit